MADIIDFPPIQDFDSPQRECTEDAFLIDEGLELLALYRSIQDPDVRASITSLMRCLAKASLSTAD